MDLGFLFRAWERVRAARPKVVRGLFFVFGFLIFLVIAFWLYTNVFDPSGFGILSEQDRAFLNKAGPALAVLFTVADFVRRRISAPGSLSHKIVSDYDRTDMKFMAKYMTKADRVIIYSGDFSYVYDYEPLYNILIDLADRECLQLLSYKRRETVLRLSESKRGQKECLFSKLLSSNNMIFEVDGQAKFLLVFRKGEEVLLYRHRDESADYVTIFRAVNPQAKVLVETIKTLVETVQRSRA